MSTYEDVPQGESEDKAWGVHVEKLKQFLQKEATETELFDPAGDSYSETYHEDHAAAKAFTDAEDGSFEAASTYLDSEVEKANKEIQAAGNNQERLAAWEVRLSTLEKLKEGLERE